jgi:hypothetical protein
MTIEKKFDIPFIAALALREKQIQQNYRPIIAVHKWFARRPGTLFRGLIFSELVDKRPSKAHSIPPEEVVSMVKIYKLYVQRVFKIFIFGMLGIFTLVGILILVGAVHMEDGQGSGPPPLFGLFWLGIVGIQWYYWVLSLPHTIRVSDDNQIEFTSIIRRQRATPREIRSIAPYNSQFGFLVIKTDHGKIRLLNQFDGFHEFLTWLKANNPAVELKGC